MSNWLICFCFCSALKAGQFSVADLGTRAGLHSQTLISTGLADLDRILGGGLPLGAVLLLLEDAYCPHGSTLLRYFAAEGVACGHRVHWTGAARPEATSLPSLAKSQSASQVSRLSFPKSLPALQNICTEHLLYCYFIGCPILPMQAEDREPGKEEDPKLRIAWQYRRYIQRQQDRAEQPGPPVAPTSRRKGVGDVSGEHPDLTSPSGSTAGTLQTNSHPAHPASSGNFNSVIPQTMNAIAGGSSGSKATAKSKSSSGMRDWCHQFDLSRPTDASALRASHLVGALTYPLLWQGGRSTMHSSSIYFF